MLTSRRLGITRRVPASPDPVPPLPRPCACAGVADAVVSVAVVADLATAVPVAVALAVALPTTGCARRRRNGNGRRRARRRRRRCRDRVEVGVVGPTGVTVGVALAPCGDGLLARTAFTGGAGVSPFEACDAPLGLPAPGLPTPTKPEGVPPAAGLGAAVVGVVPKSGRTGPAERAENSGGAIGPEPMLNPATTDRAAAATAPAAMKRLRPKSLGAATDCRRDGARGNPGGRAPERTGRKDFFQTGVIASVSPSGLRPPHHPPLLVGQQCARARLPSSEMQTPLNFHHITLGSV